MRATLMRGFTTVRDVGGADLGLKLAVEEGSFEGPRLVICGKALSQTGGHTDYRGAFGDLIVVEGNPLDSIELLTEQGRFMPMIVKGGRVVKDELAHLTWTRPRLNPPPRPNPRLPDLPSPLTPRRSGFAGWTVRFAGHAPG